MVDLWGNWKKKCPFKVAEDIYSRVKGYPYYVQKLSSIVWDETDTECNTEIVQRSLVKLVELESVDFEGIWGGLTLVQKSVLKAMACEHGRTPFSKENMEKSRVSAGGMQKAIKLLIGKDIIEKNVGGTYRLTDPIME